VLARGFSVIECPHCREKIAVGFSCKGRGFCPACCGRRMASGAADLVDHVLPHASLRQWVITLPFELRARLAYDGELLGAVSRAFVDSVLDWYRRKMRDRGLDGGKSGAVTVVQRVSSDLRINPHLSRAPRTEEAPQRWNLRARSGSPLAVGTACDGSAAPSFQYREVRWDSRAGQQVAGARRPATAAGARRSRRQVLDVQRQTAAARAPLGVSPVARIAEGHSQEARRVRANRALRRPLTDLGEPRRARRHAVTRSNGDGGGRLSDLRSGQDAPTYGLSTLGGDKGVGQAAKKALEEMKKK
jgi:Transposase zinc-binding domain